MIKSFSFLSLSPIVFILSLSVVTYSFERQEKELLNQFQKRGGKGIQFLMAVTEDSDAKDEFFVVSPETEIQDLISLFPKWKKNSALIKTLESIRNSRAPIVLVNSNFFPVGVLAQVMPLDSSKSSIAFIKKIKSVSPNVIFVSMQSTANVIVHEYQHWLDFENSNFIFDFKAQVHDILKKTRMVQVKNRLDLSNPDFVAQSLIEQRGYAAEINYLHDNNLSATLIQEAALAFQEIYLEPFIAIMKQVRKSDPIAYQKLNELLKKMELPSNYLSLFASSTKINTKRPLTERSPRSGGANFCVRFYTSSI